MKGFETNKNKCSDFRKQLSQISTFIWTPGCKKKAVK